MDTKAMKARNSLLDSTPLKRAVVIGVVVICVIVAVAWRAQWMPVVAGLFSPGETSSGDHEEDSHSGHAESDSLEVSPQARKNISLTTGAIELRSFVRTVSIPAIVIARPGRSQVEVTATLGGRVTRIYAIEGEAVEPGQPLFDLRLTHEELVQAQGDFLRTAEELDVALRDIKRLKSVSIEGAIPGKTIREREYEQQKLEAVLNAQQQSLMLHGLTKEQVASILEDRQLVQGVTVYTPDSSPDEADAAPPHAFTVRLLHVKPGQYVIAGAPLCQLMDYRELYIQGRAFEQDADALTRAAREGWETIAVTEADGDTPRTIPGLQVVYVDNEVESESRALHFYVRLRNDVEHVSETAEGHRIITWRYKPGQRMQLRVPVEQWENRIVVPVGAIAKDGIEYYMFQENGSLFQRRPVHVEYMDQSSAVIANDGSLFPGDVVAMSGAHQLQMALKNMAGGAPDPHAGHSH